MINSQVVDALLQMGKTQEAIASAGPEYQENLKKLGDLLEAVREGTKANRDKEVTLGTLEADLEVREAGLQNRAQSLNQQEASLNGRIMKIDERDEKLRKDRRDHNLAARNLEEELSALSEAKASFEEEKAHTLKEFEEREAAIADQELRIGRIREAMGE